MLLAGARHELTSVNPGTSRTPCDARKPANQLHSYPLRLSVRRVLHNNAKAESMIIGAVSGMQVSA
jgi:hypothetical protein